MVYTTLKCGMREYKLRLTAKAFVELERRLGQTIFSIFGGMGDDISRMPKLEVVVAMLHASLQAYEHRITMEDTYEIYDKYLEHGGSYASMLMELVEVLKVSGFFKGMEQPESETAEKANA